MAVITEDIKRSWLNVIRRMQAAVSSSRGWAIVSIDVLVDGCGDPKVWTEPTLRKIEPKSADLVMLARALIGEDT